MFKKIENNSFEVLDDTPHPDFEVQNTTVSEYFRKYAVGKVDSMPSDPRSEVTDRRSDDEMISDDSMINHMGCDDLDVLQEMENNREKFEAAINEIELSEKQKEAFLDACAILDKPDSTLEQKREAYDVLEELHDKVTHTH